MDLSLKPKIHNSTDPTHKTLFSCCYPETKETKKIRSNKWWKSAGIEKMSHGREKTGETKEGRATGILVGAPTAASLFKLCFSNFQLFLISLYYIKKNWNWNWNYAIRKNKFRNTQICSGMKELKLPNDTSETNSKPLSSSFWFFFKGDFGFVLLFEIYGGSVVF